MHRFRLFSVWVCWGILGIGTAFWGRVAYAQDTLPIFRPHADTLRLGFDDVLRLSAAYDSADRDDWHYIYRWNTGDRTDAVQVKYKGKSKILYTVQRLSAIHWPDEYDTLRLDAVGSSSFSICRYVADPKADTVILRAPDMEGENVRYAWSNDSYFNAMWMLPDTEQCAVVYRGMWNRPEREYNPVYYCMGTAESDKGTPMVLQSYLMLYFDRQDGIFVQPPAGRRRHDYNVWSMPRGAQIYARLGDTIRFFSEMDYEVYPEYAEYADLELSGYEWLIAPHRVIEVSHGSERTVYFKDSIYRNAVWIENSYLQSTGTGVYLGAETQHYVYWGIKPYAEIEEDSVWVSFPQYPSSDLGGRVDICWPPDAPLPAASDTMQVFNLGPLNHALEYVEYAWFDGTKDVLGADSVVGTDSAFAYLFGRMDSVNPYLYAGTLVTRVETDSIWRDSCDCIVLCTDDSCQRYDTVRIYLHRLPFTEGNVFLPQRDTLCAHLDLELRLPEEAVDEYRAFWLDKDSVALPYGYDTARYTVQGMQGLDGYGVGTDTREPRFFQLRLDHRYCEFSFFDTLLVYDQVRPAFELLCHDTVICLDEPVEMDTLSPQVYRPFYVFEWNDETKGSGYTFTDSGVYVLQFFVNKDYAVCGYDTAFDTIRVRWSDPAQTRITLSDTSFCEKLSVTLDASVPFPTTLYSWQDGPLPDPEQDFGDETDSIIFTLISKREIKEEGIYNISLLDTMGCINRKEIAVTIDDCSPKLEIPNVFTPNGDGVNDVWKFKQLERCTDVKVEVVDRWGQPVLKTKVATADNFEWNGTINNKGRRLPDGPYFYMVTYKDVYGKNKVQSGSITILGTAE